MVAVVTPVLRESSPTARLTRLLSTLPEFSELGVLVIKSTNKFGFYCPFTGKLNTIDLIIMKSCQVK